MALRLTNLVRRVTIASSEGGAWGFNGYSIPNLRGTSQVTSEGEDYDPTELFSGIGIIARPAASDNAEAVLMQIGAEADHPVIVAIRNEKARARYVAEFGEPNVGEIALFNSSGLSRILITDNGDIEVTPAAGRHVFMRTKGGTSERLARKSDIDGHTHPAGTLVAPNGGGPVTGITGGAAAIVGTSAVEGE